MTETANLQVVILAAGQGKRMASRLPKVLHTLAGRPMLAHVVEVASELCPERTLVVHGHGGEQVRKACSELDVEWVAQQQQLGTGHAVSQALPYCGTDSVVLVLYGDVPLIRAETLRPLVESARSGALALLTVRLADPQGYGRILRDDGDHVVGIVEQKDADPEQQLIEECNTGILAAPASALRTWVTALDNQNSQGEYYLTDVIAMASGENHQVVARTVSDHSEVLGANDRIQLAILERSLQKRYAQDLMLAGATLADPARVDVRGQVTVGKDCVIDVNVIFEGRVQIGEQVRIGPHCVVRDCVLEDGCQIHAHCVLESAHVGRGCQVGPFARLRPGAELAATARVGNFVEIKNSRLGEGAKANHLSYIGDAEVGRDANVGAGTITCNYDGANKHRTRIGERAFIGSNTALVAPVEVGAGATIGAGSTISRDVPADTLAVERGRLRTIEGWSRPRKTR